MRVYAEVFLFVIRFNRDRFVLSAGHACLLQYIQLHLSGYDAWTMDALKTYHNPKFGVSVNSMAHLRSLLMLYARLPYIFYLQIAAGHPEIEYPGIEV